MSGTGQGKQRVQLKKFLQAEEEVQLQMEKLGAWSLVIFFNSKNGGFWNSKNGAWEDVHGETVIFGWNIFHTMRVTIPCFWLLWWYSIATLQQLSMRSSADFQPPTFLLSINICGICSRPRQLFSNALARCTCTNMDMTWSQMHQWYTHTTMCVSSSRTATWRLEVFVAVAGQMGGTLRPILHVFSLFGKVIDLLWPAGRIVEEKCRVSPLVVEVFAIMFSWRPGFWNRQAKQKAQGQSSVLDLPITFPALKRTEGLRVLERTAQGCSLSPVSTAK